MKITPSIGSKGIFQLKTPFTIPTTKTYTCHAIRSFKDIYEDEVDVFTEYYEPFGLTSTDFDRDVAEDASIVTLVSSDNEFVYVPNTYILAIPNMSDVNYQRLVLSIDFGLLPEYVDLENIKDELASVASKVVGKEPTVNVHVAATSGLITPEQHQVLEAARLAAIEFDTTNYGKYLKQVQINNELMTRIAILQQICIDNGYVGSN